jgi:Trypsin-like peptidase domain
VIESLLVAITRVSTVLGEKPLTNATGFFFQRDGRLFLVTSRHVVLDEATQHRPDRLEIEIHTDATNIAQVRQLSVPLYAGNKELWRQAVDSAGMVDIVAVEIPRRDLSEKALLAAFTPAHLVTDFSQIEVGAPVLVVGFPLGFHDNLHHLPVARQAVIASAFGIRFQGQGYFLTDALLHRGTSGAPVVARIPAPASNELPWMLLGVHATRLDVSDRDLDQDERLNLNCAWYADVLLTLTEDASARPKKSRRR